jgi:erythromycin esterase-like protein
MALAEAIQPLAGTPADYDPLVESAKNARFALLGEASHGTHEFYCERAEITKRLIAEANYTAVTVEGDWPDAYRVNQFVRGAGEDSSPEEALEDFRRFPSWMWRNTDVVDFLTWLREWNDALPEEAPKTGFYGLDLYSLYTSMEAVVTYLEEVDPEAAQRARQRYACFEHMNRDAQVYAYETAFGGKEPCQQQAVEQLVELRDKAAELARNAPVPDDRHFYAEQNARLVMKAEEYYRAVFRGGAESWNLRDLHMAETLEELVTHLERTTGRSIKAAVWAHNSHVGDAQATEAGQRGQLNIGQLVRARRAEETLLAGFTTYTGTVTAASDWGGPAERKRVRRALNGSWEHFFHQLELPRFLLETAELQGTALERAIGVIYKPETERLSHYFDATLADQFDVVIHIDETRAVEPLERTSEWIEGDLPETYPWAV